MAGGYPDEKYHLHTIRELHRLFSSNGLPELRRLFSFYGLPGQLISDNGPQFTSEEFQHFLKLNRVKQNRSAPYHPSSNGAMERFVRTFKQT